jgi:hypothetical protein
MCRILMVVSLSLAFLACGRTEPKPRKPKELETVDIGSGYDAALSTEADKKERRIKADVGGVLPSDFPAGLPVFSPSSIVDFGHAADSGGFVVLDSPVTRSEVASSLRTRVERAGWAVESVNGEVTTYSKGGQRVDVRLTDLGSGTRIRYEY